MEHPKERRLLDFYMRQWNPYSCSAASVLTILNFIRLNLPGRRPASLVTREELLDKVAVAHWKEKVSLDGYKGRHGLSIHELGSVMKASLKIFEIPYHDFSTIWIYPGMKNLEEAKSRLFSLLNQKFHDPRIHIIAHFTQGVCVGNWYGGHVSPVGEFDPQKGRVLILDVDDEIEGPYWTDFDIFFEGLMGEAKVFGTKGGGYVGFQVHL